VSAATVATSTRGVAFREVVSIVHPWRRMLGLVGILVLVSALLELVPPLVMRAVVDDHLTVGQIDGLLPLALLYLAATMTIDGTSALATYLTAVAAQGGLNQLRNRLFAHLQALPIGYYDRTPLGDTISRCTADVDAVDTLFSSGVANVVADLVRLVTISIAMVALSPPLAFLSALVVLPLALVTRLFQVRVRRARRVTQEVLGLLTTRLQEDLSGVEVIRAFHRQPEFVRRFRRGLRRYLAAFNEAIYYAALYPPTTALLAALVTALLLWAGTGEAFAAWDISIGTLTAFILLFQRFFKPITALGEEWHTVQSALSGAERIFDVLNLPAEGRPPGNGRPDPWPGSADAGDRVTPAIVLERVSFGYLPDAPVLRDVSLAVRPGEHVALVGRTGAGKSSVLHLLGGLYTPWSGSVRVAGRDPGAIAAEERRHLVGVVPQVVQLFGGSVLDNLTLYDRTVGREAVERAATVTGADRFVRALPRGYDTPLSGSGRGAGVQLSAGQRQLLALTRALVWDPAVLLFDEATAAVDAASEAEFRAALRNSATRRGCAILTVAHRLATAREADRVLVMEAGRVVEAGPPEALIRGGGRFAALVELEAAGWDWESDGAE
jgi:ATP-binding cassette, subfamily B, multidrug efflux pump